MRGLGRLTRGAVARGNVVCRWWLVVDDEDAAGRIVDGPFEERADARWAATTQEGTGPMRIVYGIPRTDGSVSRRPSPDQSLPHAPL